MGKILVLLFIISLAGASLTGYLLLTEKIASGEQQIAAGEKQLAEGQQMLAKGKAKLANGRRELAGVKQASTLSSIGLAIVSLPVSGAIYMESQGKIAAGDQMVAQGAAKVKVGEGRIATGQLALSRGKERLMLANSIRVACLLGAAFFVFLAIALGFYWRRSLAGIFTRSDQS